MKRFLMLVVAVMVTFFSSQLQALAQTEDHDGNETYVDIEQEFDNELRMPMVGPKLRSYVRSYMKTIAEALYHAKYEVETMREGEVVIAIIPTDELFAPNDTVLMATASKKLEYFKQYAQPIDRFKIVIAVHSDDTGSEEYLYDLTERRTVAVLDYLESIGFSPDNIVGYPKGYSSPIAESTSRANRMKNRRLEIFIVPSQELLNQARQSSKK